MTVLSDLLYAIPIALGILATATLLGWMLALTVRVAVRALVDAWHARESRSTVRVGSVEFDREVFDAQRLDRVRPVSPPNAERAERATSERW